MVISATCGRMPAHALERLATFPEKCTSFFFLRSSLLKEVNSDIIQLFSIRGDECSALSIKCCNIRCACAVPIGYCDRPIMSLVF